MPIKTQILTVNGQPGQFKELILPIEQLLEYMIVNAPQLVPDAISTPRRATRQALFPKSNIGSARYVEAADQRGDQETVCIAGCDDGASMRAMLCV